MCVLKNVSALWRERAVVLPRKEMMRARIKEAVIWRVWMDRDGQTDKNW